MCGACAKLEINNYVCLSCEVIKMKLSSNPKIIISRTDNIGDVVLTLPLAAGIKAMYPNSEIIFLGKGYIKPLIDSCENIDKFIDCTTLSIDQLNADVIIHVFPDPDITRMAYKAGIKYRIGTSHRFYNWLYCNKRVDFTRKNSSLHEAQLNFKLVTPLGIKDIPSLELIGKSYGLTKFPYLDKEWEALLDKDKFNLIIHPLSRGSARNWDWKNYNKLIEILPTNQYKIFVTGTEEETEQNTENILLYHSRVIDMTGRLSFAQLIAFINRTDGLVAASTGPLHIAAALGKRAIGLYPSIKPMHPGRWAPLGPKAKYLSLIKDCEDCRNGGKCVCINTIRPEQIKELLVG